MFFSWYLQNRHFKQRGNLKGQVTPLLLLVLVILLIAAITTVNIGRFSLDKTCSANGADAGSLAAASNWAAALNSLALINEELQIFYDENYYTYGQLYSIANDYIIEAIIYLAVASGFIAVATVSMYNFLPTCCDIWYPMLVASIADAAASIAMLQSSIAVSAFNTTVQYMLSLTDSFHDSQLDSFCSVIKYMQESYEVANKSGFSFAFSNSCITSKLSEEQGNEFQVWMSTERPFNDRIYNWVDKINQNHSVSVTLDMPNISSYTLQHTTGSYSDITGLLGDLISRSQVIASVLNSTAVILATIAVFATTAFINSLLAALCCPPCFSVIGSPFCCTVMKTSCWIAFHSYSLAVGNHSTVVGVLALIVAAAGALSIYLLEDKNNEAFSKWEPDLNNFESIDVCEDCESGEICGAAKNLLIVKIAEVILPRWDAVCCVTQIHPGTSAGIVLTTYPDMRSCSTSRFSGGDVGNFIADYDSIITDVN